MATAILDPLRRKDLALTFLRFFFYFMRHNNFCIDYKILLRFVKQQFRFYSSEEFIGTRIFGLLTPFFLIGFGI